MPVPFRRRRRCAAVAVVVAPLAALAGCGEGRVSPTAASDVHRIVASTSVVGDVVRAVAPEGTEVDVLMGAGADPHEVELSARQAERVHDAHLVVIVGGGLEERLHDVLDDARDRGVRIVALLDAIDALDASGHAHRHDDDEDEDHDPHFWHDPRRMAAAVRELGSILGAEDRAERYAARLEALDAELASELATIPPTRRVLVTLHAGFAYFADRYDFEVAGTVLDGGHAASASPRHLEELAALVRERGIPAVFGEHGAPTRLLESLAREAGRDVAVVELYGDALGPDGSGAETYIGMLRTNAALVRDALGGG